MTRQIKRRIVLRIASAACAVGLAGCSGDDGPEANESDGSDGDDSDGGGDEGLSGQPDVWRTKYSDRANTEFTSMSGPRRA